MSSLLEIVRARIAAPAFTLTRSLRKPPPPAEQGGRRGRPPGPSLRPARPRPVVAQAELEPELASQDEPEPPALARQCVHCGHAPANRPRGLCWSCFYAPGVRDQYAMVENKYVRRGAGIGCGGYQLDSTPTSARPGTLEKIAVLEDRAARRVSLWHPHDAK